MTLAIYDISGFERQLDRDLFANYNSDARPAPHYYTPVNVYFLFMLGKIEKLVSFGAVYYNDRNRVTAFCRI